MAKLSAETRARLVVGTVSVVALLALWEAIGRSPWTDVRFTSRPTLLVQAAGDLLAGGDLFHHLGISALEFVSGFVLSVAVGIPLGLAMGWYRRLRLLLEPTLMAFYSVPRTALFPLLIVWFGIGPQTQAAVVFLGAVFPVLINTMTGVQEVDPTLVRAARSFGARDGQIFRRILLPGSLPFMMAGVRLGLGRGLIGVIVGEMYVSTAGIGNLIMTYQSGLNTDKLILLVFLVAALGYVLVTLARNLEDRMGAWRQERRAA